jgi:hypothetical protein
MEKARKETDEEEENDDKKEAEQLKEAVDEAKNSNDDLKAAVET